MNEGHFVSNHLPINHSDTDHAVKKAELANIEIRNGCKKRMREEPSLKPKKLYKQELGKVFEQHKLEMMLK